jgi:Ni/Co efflux regulator RcnB
MKGTIRSIFAATLIYVGAQLPAAADVGVSVEFSDEEIRLISAWYEDHGSSAGHGGGKSKSKGKGLPPGIAKNLGRGKALPPGIAKQQLPDGLVHTLPAAPRGYERVIVDGRVLLVEIATQVIHDVLSDIVLR